jgi:hypothetical protein
MSGNAYVCMYQRQGQCQVYIHLTNRVFSGHVGNQILEFKLRAARSARLPAVHIVLPKRGRLGVGEMPKGYCKVTQEQNIALSQKKR